MFKAKILMLMIFVLVGMTTFAQDSQQGSITGFISDQSQAAVVGVEVTVINLKTGISRKAITNSAGLYTVVGLQPGTYEAQVKAQGFKSAKQIGIVINIGVAVRANFTLDPGEVADTVTVTADTTLNTETGEVSNLISGRQVSEVALNGRNFTQFLSLGTGVSSAQTGRQMGVGQEGNPLMSVHGGRISMNKFTYDGTLAMDTGGNRGLDMFPPMEAIAEVKVQKSNYSADAGGFGYSVVNVVTKSGGKSFHGDVYEYFRNDKMDARNFFASERQTLRLNNFGYTLGGPIYIPGKYNQDRTKDFFFWSQTWARRVGPQLDGFAAPPRGVFTAQVPSEAMRRGDFRELKTTIKDPVTGKAFDNNTIPTDRIDKNALIILNNFYPLPNSSGTSNYVYNTHAFTTFREELIRWDHYFNNNWSLMARYAQDTWAQDQDIKRPSNTLLPTFPNRFDKPGKNLTTKLATVISPQMVNQFTFGYSFNRISNTPRGGMRPNGLNITEAFSSNTFNLIPNINLAQGYAGIGVGDVLNNSNPIFTFKEDFSLSFTKHNLKFGAEIIRHRKKSISYAQEQGVFSFNGNVTGHAVADFLLGRAFSYSENDADKMVEVSASANEFYAQDDYKVTKSFTLNLGARWFLIRGGNGGAEINDRISTFVPSQYNPTVAPQLTANGQLVKGTGDSLNGIVTPQKLKGLDDIGRALKRPVNNAIGPRTGFAWSLNDRTVIRGGYGINYFWGANSNEGRGTNPPFINSVNIQSANLSNPTGSVGALFPPNVNSLDVYPKQPSVQSWSLTIQREIMSGTMFEIGYAGTRGTHLPRTIQLNQADPTLTTNANLRRPYRGYGSIPYQENSGVAKYHGLEASVSRRTENGLFLEASYTFSKSLGHGEGLPLDSRQKDLDFGLTDLDRKHLFNFNYVYEFPFFKGKSGLGSVILGNWQLSGIVAFQSGTPFTVTQGGDVANFGGNTGAQRPDLIGNPNEGRGDDITRYFNTAAFAPVTKTGSIGTAGINIARGPGISNFDMSLFKNIPIREQLRLQFGVEAYNIFNHTQFDNVDANISSSSFGKITSARDPRVLQLRAKLTF